MTFDTGMNITNFWKLFHYEVKRYNNEELIGIRDLLELLSQDCFNNPLKPETGNPENNIPPFDEFDYGETVSTFRALNFFSCMSPSAAESTI